jgi:CBS domain-containing protein
MNLPIYNYICSMKNSIAERIADFLKGYAPFKNLDYDELIYIALESKVINLEKNKALFSINDSLHDVFYVLASGTIHLTVIMDAEETLINKCYPGDVIGLRPFFAKNNYMMSAKAREESIVYAIPIDAFKPFVAKYIEVLDFLLQSFTTNTRINSANTENKNKDITETFFKDPSEVTYFQNLNYNKKPLQLPKGTLIKEAAIQMTNALLDAAIITENNLPIGIVTDADFREKIATGRFTIMDKVDKIMTSPLITVLDNISVAEAQLLLLKNNITHLCVTPDGTDNTNVLGIITEHDLIVSQSNNPGILIREIKNTLKIDELTYIRQRLTELTQSSLTKNIPISHITNVTSEVLFALIKRVVELAILDLGSPPARFAWLSIGSQGRKEQLLLTDQDNILIFEDVSPDKYKEVKDYFLKMADVVVNNLVKIGYPLCKFNHNANNFFWCKSLTDWIKQYNNWMYSPGEKSNQISPVFFDYEFVIGEINLEEELSQSIFNAVKNNVLFFDYLGNDAIKKPAAFTFFKKFNVEEDGPYKDFFDIKRKGLQLYIDAARLFVLSHNIKSINNTYLRFKQMAIVDVKNAESYLNFAENFLVLSKFRALEGLKNDTDGQYIAINELNKSDREKLKNALIPLKDLEELIKDKYQLTQFS